MKIRPVRDGQRLRGPDDHLSGTHHHQCSSRPVPGGADYSPSATDNCPGVTTNCVPPSGSTFSAGITNVQCTAMDASDNTNSCSFQVIVICPPPPCVITCPPNITMPNNPGQCCATTNYPPPVSNGQCGPVICNPPTTFCFPVGTTTVVCNSSIIIGDSDDLDENEPPDADLAPVSSCSFTVTVLDTQPPLISCPSDITTNVTSGACEAVVTYSASATDNCPGVTTNCVPQSGSTFSEGTTDVTCKATDAAGNTTNCSFQVTVNCPPTECTLMCPSDITTTNDPGRCCATVHYPDTTTSGDCGRVTCDPPPGTCFPVGTNTVTCTEQSNGVIGADTVGCSFRIIVRDSERPAITCPNDIRRCSGSNVTYGPSATDNCPGVTTSCVPASGSTFSSGTTPVTCTATDASGNTSSCSFQVIINSAPTVTVIAFDPKSGEQGPSSAKCQVCRRGCSNSQLLKVYYSVGGTATPGVDYVQLSGVVTIPAGQDCAFIKEKPINDRKKEPTETVVVTLTLKPSYVVGSPNSAEVVINDND